MCHSLGMGIVERALLNKPAALEVLKAIYRLGGRTTYSELIRETAKAACYLSNLCAWLERAGLIIRQPTRVIRGGVITKEIILTQQGYEVARRLANVEPERKKPVLRDRGLIEALREVNPIRLGADLHNLVYDLDQSAVVKEKPEQYVKHYSRRLSYIISLSRAEMLGLLCALSGVSLPLSMVQSVLSRCWNYGFKDKTRSLTYAVKSEKVAGLTELDIFTISPAEGTIKTPMDACMLIGKKIKELLPSTTETQVLHLLIYDRISHELLSQHEVRLANVDKDKVNKIINEQIDAGIVQKETERDFLIPGRIFRFRPGLVEHCLEKVAELDSMELEIAKALTRLGCATYNELINHLKQSLGAVSYTHLTLPTTERV